MYVKFAAEMGNTGFTVNAIKREDGTMYGFEAAALVATEAEAEQIAAKFPKGVKVVGSTIRSYADGVTVTHGWVTFRANLTSNDVTGAKNETSINRIRKFMAACEKLGLALRFDHEHCLNQIHDRAEVERQLA